LDDEDILSEGEKESC